MILKTALVAILVDIVLGSHWHPEDKHHHAPQPYKFGYEVKDKEGAQHRHEEGDGHGNVRGSYGYTDHKGLYREVHYIADKGGFRAVVKTNEPGTANQNPAAVQVHANPPHHHHHAPHHHAPYHHVENHHGSHLHNLHHHHGAHLHNHHVPFIGYNSNYFAPLHGYSYNPSIFHDYGNWPFANDNKYHQFHKHAHEYSALNNHHKTEDPHHFNHFHGFNGLKGFNFDKEGFGFDKEGFSGKNGFEEAYKGLNFEADLKDGKHKSWRYGHGNF